MRKIALIVLFIFVLGVMGVQALEVEKAVEDENLLGRISLVEGSVKIKYPDGDKFVEANLGSRILVDSLLKVAKDGKVEICYLDGSFIRFKAGSRVQFKKRSLRLYTGKVWLRVMKLGKKFEVVTPTFVAGVRGTVFTVAAGDKKGQTGEVSVYEGTVYSKVDDKSVDVTAGNHVVIESNGTIGNITKNSGNFDPDFKELDWQASDRQSAYKRYLMLLLKGVDAEKLNSKASEEILKERKKLPEVQNAYFTYESFEEGL